MLKGNTISAYNTISSKTIFFSYEDDCKDPTVRRRTVPSWSPVSHSYGNAVLLVLLFVRMP